MMADKRQLDLGGAVWVSAVIEQTVDRLAVARSLLRHRSYSFCDRLAVSHEAARSVYLVNRDAMNMVLEQSDVDSSGWRPRFASLWTHPTEISSQGKLRQINYWIVTDMTRRLYRGDEPLGTLILSGRELRRHGFGVFAGAKPRDVAPVLRAIGCQDRLRELLGGSE